MPSCAALGITPRHHNGASPAPATLHYNENRQRLRRAILSNFPALSTSVIPPQELVVIVGAGAAGLLAAIRAAERGRRVLLLEKNRRPGVKILMSGGTRCNLTHATDGRGIIAAFERGQGNFLQSAVAALSPQQLVALIEAEGVPTKVEASGKIFPVSDRATDVLQALLKRLARSGAELSLAEPLDTCTVVDGRFRLRTARRELTADRLLITSGGQSYPGSGTCGDGYTWARQLGHSVTPLRPALTPLTSNERWVTALQGITIPDVAVQVMSGDEAVRTHTGGKVPAKQILAHRRGSLLLAHFGLSGPVAMDVSRAVSGHRDPSSLVLRCDFLPNESEEPLSQQLQAWAAESGRRTLESVVGQWLPQRLAEALLDVSDLPRDRRLSELSRAERQRLVFELKRQDIRLSGTRGYKKAEVTAGGVALREVDSRTMESKLQPGLFFAGEVLDFDGPIGGYNFQAAFSTGWLAGSHI